MNRSSSSRSSLPSSRRSKESSSSSSRSSRTGASTRGRSPRRSLSPRARRRSPSSSRSSRRSPPRRTSRARSPSRDSRSRRGSEQRDGSLSRRISLGRHPQFACRHSPNRHSESSEEQSLQTAVGNDRYSIYPLERRRLGSPVDSLSDVNRGDFAECPVFSRRLSCHQSLERYYSPERNPSSSFSRRYNKDYHSRDVSLYEFDFNMNYDHLQDASREPDRDGKLFCKRFYSSEEREREPKRYQYDREDRLLDVNMDSQGSLPGKQNYYRRNLSRSPSPAYSDEDFREVENSRRKRNTCEDMPASGGVIPGLTNPVQSSESQFLPSTLSKRSILKKRIDEPSVQVNNFLKWSNKNAIAESANKDPEASVDDWRAFPGLQQNASFSEQNLGSFLRKEDYQESTRESADLLDDFLLSHEKASQDKSGFLRILDRMTDSTNSQEKIGCSFLDIEDEDGDDSKIKYPSTEKLKMNSWKESLSPVASSSIKSIKPDTSDGSRIEYEKIHDLFKAIGLDIGVGEIDKGAARTEERLHGKKQLRSLDGHSVISHKLDSSEKDCIQSNSHSLESDQKNSLSLCGSFQPSNDVSSVSVSEYTQSKTFEHNTSGGSSELSFPPVTVTPSAPPSLLNLPLPTPPIYQYPVSYFSALTTPQLLPNYPPPTIGPPVYNTYGHCRAYSASTHLQQSSPALPDVQRLESAKVPPKPTRPNLRVIESVSRVKENPEIKRNVQGLESAKVPPKPSRPNLRIIESVSRVKENPEIKRNVQGLETAKVPPKPTRPNLRVIESVSTAKDNPEIKRNVQGLETAKVPPKPTRPNLRVIETVSAVKENPEIKRNNPVLIEIPITPTNSTMLFQSSVGDTTERISDEKNQASEMPKVIEEEKKLVSGQETQQKKLQSLKTELDRRSNQQWQMLCNKLAKKDDPLLAEVNKVQEKIMNEIVQLQKQSQVLLQIEPIVPGINLSKLSCKKPSEKEKSKNTKKNTSNLIKVMDKKEKLRTEQETRRMKLRNLKDEFNTFWRKREPILQNKNIRYKSVLLAQMAHTNHNIMNEINRLQLETEIVEKKQSELDKDFLNKNSLCDEKKNLDHQTELSLVQETECSLKRKWCKKEKEDRDERNTKVARKEESEIINELREKISENEINKGKDSYGQKLMIKLVLKKHDRKVENEGEKEESQKALSQLSSEKCSLRETETDNQSQDQDVTAPKYQSVDEGKCRDSKSQSGNPDSEQKVSVAELKNLGMMMTKEQKIAESAQESQQVSQNFDSPCCYPLSPLPPRPLSSQVSSSALDKPAPAKTSGIKFSDASSKLPPLLKNNNNPELGPPPNNAKAFEGGAVVLTASQGNITLQEEVETQKPENVSDIMECEKVQKQEVTETKAGKCGAAKKHALLKIPKMKPKLPIFQRPYPPPLLPDPRPLLARPLLALPLRPLLSLAPALPCPPHPLFPLAISGPASQGHPVYTYQVPYLNRRDKRLHRYSVAQRSLEIELQQLPFITGPPVLSHPCKEET